MPASSGVVFNGVQRDGPASAGDIGSLWQVGPDGSLTEVTIDELDFSVLPTTDPLIAGKGWRDPITGYVTVSFGNTPYTPSADFSDTRNSMYIAAVI